MTDLEAEFAELAEAWQRRALEPDRRFVVMNGRRWGKTRALTEEIAGRYVAGEQAYAHPDTIEHELPAIVVAFMKPDPAMVRGTIRWEKRTE